METVLHFSTSPPYCKCTQPVVLNDESVLCIRKLGGINFEREFRRDVVLFQITSPDNTLARESVLKRMGIERHDIQRLELIACSFTEQIAQQYFPDSWERAECWPLVCMVDEQGLIHTLFCLRVPRS